ncbi:rhamnogalacturonan acetylesterase [Akkermansiaceae bacterium]|nr:rhamnogalacturonan acetylesterase [Akkermansiaceae bacterium]
MNFTIVLISSLLFTLCAPAQEKALTIGLIGDSTVANTYGWGPSFASLVSEKATVLNFAKNGATLQSLSTRLDELLKKNPNYVLIQFGHNDQKKYSAEAYRGKLASYVDRVEKSGSKAVILSSVTRRNFDDKGHIQPVKASNHPSSLPLNAKAAGAVAKLKKVPFLDLYALSVAHHNEIGPDKSASYNFDENDRTHFSKKGADAIASLILTELRVIIPGL